jgi:arylsulfatase A
MKWPGIIPAGANRDKPVAAMDLFTTFACIAGAEIFTDRVIDGKNILSLMKNEPDAKSPHQAIFGFKATGGLMSVRYQNWKLVFPGKDRTDLSKPALLFDLINDQKESTDVAKNHPDVVKTILKLAEEADNAINANKPIILKNQSLQ